jgi:hypothetical protein
MEIKCFPGPGLTANKQRMIAQLANPSLLSLPLPLLRPLLLPLLLRLLVLILPLSSSPSRL